jgi:hypothetical protein
MPLTTFFNKFAPQVSLLRLPWSAQMEFNVGKFFNHSIATIYSISLPPDYYFSVIIISTLHHLPHCSWSFNKNSSDKKYTNFFAALCLIVIIILVSLSRILSFRWFSFVCRLMLTRKSKKLKWAKTVLGTKKEFLFYGIKTPLVH